MEFGISEPVIASSVSDAENNEVATWLIRLSDNNINWGFSICYLYLRNIKYFKWKNKHFYQIYKKLELNLRIELRKRLVREKPEALKVPLTINQVWSMNFINKQLEYSRTFRLFNLIDNIKRDAISLEVDFSLPTARDSGSQIEHLMAR